MTSLLIRRPKALWQDRLRKYRVIVDGTEAGKIANGAELDIPLSAGKHVVQLKIDWCQSPSMEVDITAGQTLILECGPNAKPWLVLFYITLFTQKYLWLRRSTSSADLSYKRATPAL